MEVRLEQLEKASSPMLVTLLPMVTDERLEQEPKVNCSIFVTPLGMVIEVRLEQFVKACNPILVTLSGIVTEDRLEQPPKVLGSIFVTPLGMSMEVRLVHS